MCNLTLEAKKFMKLDKNEKIKLLKTSLEHKIEEKQKRTLETDLARADDDGFALPEKERPKNNHEKQN